jgi:hypothetical protein
MLAASSTDDITLISKKKKVTKTRSSDSPYRNSDPTMPPSPSMRNRGLKLPLKKSYKPLRQERYPLEQRNGTEAITAATDIDSGRTVLVASRDNIDYNNQPLSVVVQSHSVNNAKASSCSPTNPAPPRLGNIHAHAYSKSFDVAELDLGSKVNYRNAVNGEHDVRKLRGMFESPPPGQQAPPTSRQTGNFGRRNSNSDSGRESMVLDCDPLQAV